MEDHKHELIVCIVNAGYSQNVMEAARSAGAQGGPEAEEFFSINIQSDKELLLILVPKDIKDDVMKAVYKDCGLADEAMGIAFSLPVNRTTTIKE